MLSDLKERVFPKNCAEKPVPDYLRTCRIILFWFIFITLCGSGCRGQESYRAELEQRGIAFTPESFFRTVHVGDRSDIELFLKAGMNVNVRGENGYTPLMWASASHDTEIVSFFIEKGADVNAENEDGYTALMFAASTGNKQMVELFIERGADINARNQTGETALMLASLNDRIEVVRALLEHGANVYAKNEKGETALTYAFLNTRIIDLLKKAMSEKK
jgi:hypothetical protein